MEYLFRGKRVDNGEWVEGAGYLNGFILKGMNGNYRELNGGIVYREVQSFEVLPETVGMWTGLTDKENAKVFQGDIGEGTFSVKVGEERSRIGKSRNYGTYSIYKDISIRFVVEYEKGCWCANSGLKVYYKTHFYRGVGYTKAERQANELRETYSDFKKSLSLVIRETTIIGNIHDTPELLEPKQ